MNKYGISILWSDEDQGYIATCPEFPGLSAFGETAEQSLSEARIALELFIKTYKEDGLPLPEPQSLPEYSGQFRVRIPHNLHRQLAQMAERDGVSLNQFVLEALAERVGAQQIYDRMLKEVRQALTSISVRTSYVLASQFTSHQAQPLTGMERTEVTEVFKDTDYSSRTKKHKKGN
jgi:predicted RNase H-like HicB family nuclease